LFGIRESVRGIVDSDWTREQNEENQWSETAALWKERIKKQKEENTLGMPNE